MSKMLQTKELPTHPKRQIEINDLFMGRTVSYVEIPSVNAWVFHFEDGGKVEIETQAMGYSEGGSIVGLDVG
jgi:hypothetical protein